MNKKLRIEVYNKYDGYCAYCGKELKYEEMQVDHAIPKDIFQHKIAGYEEDFVVRLKYYGITEPVNYEMDDIQNLMPSCRRCNHYKRSCSIPQFRGMMLTLHERIRQSYINKVAEDFGIIKITPFDWEFFFEMYKKQVIIKEN